MKKYDFIFGIVSIVTILSFFSCEREHMATTPPLGLYKTNPEYFTFLAAWVNNSDNEVAGYPYYKPNDSRILFTEDDTIYSQRVQLNDGYVLSNEVFFGAPFTNVSFKEIVKKQDTDSSITSEILYNRIIDRNPFNVYYEVDYEFVSAFCDQYRDLGYSSAKVWYLSYQKAAEEINLMITEGKLEENFIRIK